MKNLIARLWHEEKAQDLTEYALLLALVSLGTIASMASLALQVAAVFTNAAVNLTNT